MKKYLSLNTYRIALVLILGFTSLCVPHRVMYAHYSEDSSPQIENRIELDSSISPLVLNGEQDIFFQIMDQNEQSITLELTTPQAEIEFGPSNSLGCNTLSVEGIGNTTRPGWPQVPVKGVLIGIPVESSPTLTLLESETVLLPDKIKLCPVAVPVSSVSLEGEITFEGNQLIPDPLGYSDLQNSTENQVELISTAFLRSQRVAQLLFQPFQYDASTERVSYHPRIRVRLDFNRLDANHNFSSSVVDEGYFEVLLEDNLINYADARLWRLAPSQDQMIIPASKDQTQPAYKIKVDQDGLYQITYADLVDAGIPTDTLDDLDPGSLQLINAGVEVAILVNGETGWGI